MGITSAILKVRKHRKSKKFAEVNFLVDSSAIYSLVPGKILDELAIKPFRKMSFSLADGTTLKRKVCSAYFGYEGEGGPAPVVYQEQSDGPLLGETTLKFFGFISNPFLRILHPMRMRMAKLR